MRQSKSKWISIISLMIIVFISGFYSLFLVNSVSENHAEDIEKEIEILLYRFGATQTLELEAFQNFYDKLKQLSLDDADNDVLQYVMNDIFTIDKSVQLVVDDGRLMNADVSQSQTDAKTMESFFSSNAVTGRNLIEIEAYSASEEQLIGAISRKMIDEASNQSAVLLKLIDLSPFVEDLKRLFNRKNAMIYILDENNRFADVFGSSNQMVDVAGIKSLATKAQYKGVLKAQKINGQMYDVIYKDIRELNWSIIVLVKELPAWAIKAPEMIAIITIFIVGLILLMIMYKNHAAFVFQKHKNDTFEEIYEVFNRKDGIEHWESDERHISKQALQTLSRMLPFMRINSHDKCILEAALSQIQLGVHPTYFKEPFVENRKNFNREVIGLLKALFSDLLDDIELESDLDSLDVDFDFNMLQILIIVGDSIKKMAVPGRIEIRGDSGSQALVVEFYGDLQRMTSEIYKSLINNNEHYYLFDTVNVLKLGHKLVMSKKKDTLDLVINDSAYVALSELPSSVCFIEEFSPESMILQMMIKSLGVEVKIKKADSTFSALDIILISDSYLETVMKNNQLKLAKRIVYGSKSPLVDWGGSLFIERPYQLHKIRYALALALHKEA